MDPLLQENKPKNKPKIFLLSALASSLVLAFVSLTILVSHNNDATILRGEAEQDVVTFTCAAAMYPELCISTVKSSAPAHTTIKSTKDVIFAALDHTIDTVQQNYFTLKNIGGRSNSLSLQERRALHDCLELNHDTTADLRRVKEEMKDYGFSNYSLADHRDDIMILLSAAQTNQQTCLDELSENGADETIREGYYLNIRLMSNTLAIIKNITDTETVVRPEKYFLKEMVEEENAGEKGWPEWLSAADRRLLQSATVTPNVTVAADGSGDYLTVSEAVAAAPERSSTRYVIRIKAGVYREYVEITNRKINLMFVGDGRTTTIITGNRSNAAGWSTFQSQTVAVSGEGFLARDITFQNTAGPSGNQAVALRVNRDFCAFYRCSMLAYQDTLYVHSFRQFYTDCFIAGTVDFIFGNAAVVFQNCDLRIRRPNPNQSNMVTAQGRLDPNQPTGIVIQNCKISANSDLLPVLSQFRSYLGRPWREYSRTIVMQSDITNVIDPAGWHEWSGDFALDTLYYAEYANTGEGANTTGRVIWTGFHVLTEAAEVVPFTAENFINGDDWLLETGFPVALGL